MQETKVTLIYFGLSLFIFLTLIPWVLNSDLALLALQALAMYGGIVLAFLGGLVWGWDDKFIQNSSLWYGVGFSLLGLLVVSLASSFLFISLLLLIGSLQVFLYFESNQSQYFKNNIKYSDSRKLITNLVTICCITAIAFIFNPYT